MIDTIYRMLRKDLLPPILFDQFEFVISALTGVKDCCICDIQVAETACNCFVCHCHPILLYYFYVVAPLVACIAIAPSSDLELGGAWACPQEDLVSDRFVCRGFG